jgi:prepilin-type N-terminal cleavage/methylation domain-containing protein
VKKAFTLIELLVVIAIIAILAAILFPVFAQAKEAAKKTASLSNMKQTGTSFALYMGDSDDTFPFAMAYLSAAKTWYHGDVPVPQGWRPDGWSYEPWVSDTGAVWANSIRPYSKSDALLEAPGLPTYKYPSLAYAYEEPLQPWSNVNTVMNGFLHTLQSSVVAQPSRLPLLWQWGKMNVAGQATSMPQLYCPYSNECKWSPTSQFQPQLPASDFAYYENWDGWSYWSYGKGMNFTKVDGSAKFKTLSRPGPDVSPRYAELDQPYSWMGPNGEAGEMMHCSKPSGYYQPCLFRPDSEFDYAGELQQW